MLPEPRLTPPPTRSLPAYPRLLRLTRFVRSLGPGLITGASDDPSGIATYSQAGESAYLLFAGGVIGTGLLAIPVLAGSLSYATAETFHWRSGLDRQLRQAPAFYGTIALSLIAGVLLDLFGISPIQALLYTAILYGLTAPVRLPLCCTWPTIKASWASWPMAKSPTFWAFSRWCS